MGTINVNKGVRNLAHDWKGTLDLNDKPAVPNLISGSVP